MSPDTAHRLEWNCESHRRCGTRAFKNVVRGPDSAEDARRNRHFSLVRHDPEGSHYSIERDSL